MPQRSSSSVRVRSRFLRWMILLGGLLLAAALVPVSYSLAATLNFDATVNYATGTNPGSVAVGDFNLDGKLDLATSNNGSNNVSVLLGNGNSTFAAKVDYATGTGPNAVAVDDFNGDGKPDLVTANSTGNNVSVLLGNGNGTFAAKTDYTTGTGPNAVAVGDFNRDGEPDLVTANNGSNNVSVLLGNGGGTFAAKVDYAAGTGPNAVAVGDFNRDGKLDLATANNGSNNVSVRLGNGDGTFAAKLDYATGTGPNAVAVGDFNRDGKLDLATANNGSNNVSVWLGNGDGTFAAKVDYAAGTGPNGVAVGDFNGDGKPDLVTANNGSNNVSVLVGNGDGTFAAQVDYAAGTGPNSVAVGDFDRDGEPDLATANNGSNNVGVLRNTSLFDSSGTFAAHVNYATGAAPDAIAVGDFNRDGNLDLVTANLSDNNVSILLGNGDGTFAAKVDYAAGTQPQAVVVGDFNRDGKPDVATVSSPNTVSVLLGNGDGTFAAKVDYVTGPAPSSVVVGDFNRDGKPDLVTASFSTMTVSVLLGNGDGTFAAKADYAVNAVPISVVVGDFNRDGKPDVATANYATSSASVLSGNGDGTFTLVSLFAVGTSPRSMAVGDFNHDSKLDLVTSNLSNANASVMLGNGNGTFAAKVDYTTGAGPNAVAVGDFRLFGDSDLVTANDSGDTVSVLPNNGNGTFAAKVDYSTGTGSGPRAVAVGDFNRDGRSDLVTANYFNDTAGVLLNTVVLAPTPTPTSPPTNTPTNTPTPLPGCNTTVFSEDFDGVTAPALPDGWTASNASGSALWVTSNTGSPAPVADTAPNAAFIDDPSSVSDKRLTSPSIVINGTQAQLSFMQRAELESTYDAGVLEISINGDAFGDIFSRGGSFFSGGYNRSLNFASNGNPVNSPPGRVAWSGSIGNNSAYSSVIVNLPAAADNSTIQLRWRMGSDSSSGGQGWRIDTVKLTACVPLTPTPTNTATPTNTPTPTTTPTCLAAPTVTNNADSGAGSLRQAIADACTGSTIAFNASYNIALLSQLTLNKTLTVNASGTPLTLSGNTLASTAGTQNLTGAVTVDALTINSGATLDTGGAALTLNGDLTNSGTFTPGTVTFAKSGSQAITGVTMFNTVTVNSGSTLNVGSNATLNGAITLDGNINAGANIITLGSGASLSGAGDIIGTVRRTSPATGIALPFNNQYTTLTFSTAPTQMDVALTKTVPLGSPTAVQRYYTLTPTGAVNATVQLSYQTSELNGNTESQLQLWRYNGSSWEAQGGTVNTTNHFVSVAGITQFSPWALGTVKPTAVEVTSFRARLNPKRNVSLRWSTADELNLRGFNVWRKTGNGEWVKLNPDLMTAKHIGQAVGDTYHLTDKDVKAGKTYRYKIEIVHADGTSDWTEIKSIKLP